MHTRRASSLISRSLVALFLAALSVVVLFLVVLVPPPAAPAGAEVAGTDPGESLVEVQVPLVVDVTGPVTSANASFVSATYQYLLGRAADTAGLDYHLARIASGGDRSRETFAFALAFSVEGSRREVVRAYGDLLGRAPDAAGESYWTAHLQGHGVVDLRVLLLASDEYRLVNGGGDGTWIDALYRDLLGRAPDPGGRQYWLARAQAGVPRALIAASVYIGDEALGRRVQALYQDTLGRTASAGELAGASAYIRRSDERNQRARLVASDEAFEPFLQAALP
jgi:hypothetical protein